MSIINAIIDWLRPDDVIDLYFVSSDLKEIRMTDAELVERAEFDSRCGNIKIEEQTPLGKQVK